MDKAAPHRIERSSITDQRIEMSARTGICGTDRSTLVRCEIALLPRGLPASRFGERFEFAFSRLEHCTIRARGAVKSLHFNVRTQLVDCRFEGGPFESPQFGENGPPGAPVDGWPDSLVQRCDFRDAELRNALFHSVTMDQVQLPGWPHITLLSPHAAGKRGPEPHIFVSPSAKRDSVEFAMRFISDSLERMKSGGSSIRVVQVQELIPERDLHEPLRKLLDDLGHPRIRC